MTIYIYNAGGFDGGTIGQYTGKDNFDCEQWAADNYGDTDYYAWSYVKI